MAKTVLIVEDEEAVRELEKFILEQQGYEVMVSRD
jgi:DNA-binding response OmpR family regulator